MPSDDLHADVERLRPQLVELRRHFHMHPELSFEEQETAREIAERLRALGLEVRERVGGYGVVGLLRGGTGESGDKRRTLMVRADIDALPVAEANDVDYKSQVPGRMHACGHDGHITIGLTLAQLLAERRDRLRGDVKFVFQPAEEVASGAQPMIDAGVMRNPDVDAVIGLHLWSPTHVGDVVVVPGPFFASADMFTLTVRGRGGHGAMPHSTVDPVVTAAQIVIALQTLVSREINPLHAAVVTFGSIHGGSVGNIVPDAVELTGTVRAYDPADREHLLRRIPEVAEGVARALRAEAQFTLGAGTPAILNDPEIAALMRRAAEATVGPEHIPAGDQRQSVSDDMALFVEAAPGCYIIVGAGNPERGITAPHHNARFDLDEDCLPIGLEVLARAALEYLA